jgi:hypothetical protein
MLLPITYESKASKIYLPFLLKLDRFLLQFKPALDDVLDDWLDISQFGALARVFQIAYICLGKWTG